MSTIQEMVLDEAFRIVDRRKEEERVDTGITPALILEASESIVSDYKSKMDHKDRRILELMTIRDEAINALNDLYNQKGIKNEDRVRILQIFKKGLM